MLAHEIDDVLVVPVIQCPLGNLCVSDQSIESDRARPTWKCWLLIQRDNCVNRGVTILWNSVASMTSRISSTSFKNMTSFGELTFGQYRSKPSKTSSVSPASFSKNCTTQ